MELTREYPDGRISCRGPAGRETRRWRRSTRVWIFRDFCKQHNRPIDDSFLTRDQDVAESAARSDGNALDAPGVLEQSPRGPRASTQSRRGSSTSERSTYTLLGSPSISTGSAVGNPSPTNSGQSAVRSGPVEARRSPPPAYEAVLTSAAPAMEHSRPVSLLGNVRPSPETVNSDGIPGSLAPNAASPSVARLSHQSFDQPHSTATSAAPSGSSSATMSLESAHPSRPSTSTVRPNPELNRSSMCIFTVRVQASWRRLPAQHFPVPLADLLPMAATRCGPLSYRTKPPTSSSHRNPSTSWTPPNDYTPPMNRGPEWRGPSLTYPWPDDEPPAGEEHAWYVVIRGPRVGIYRRMYVSIVFILTHLDLMQRQPRISGGDARNVAVSGRIIWGYGVENI